MYTVNKLNNSLSVSPRIYNLVYTIHTNYSVNILILCNYYVYSNHTDDKLSNTHIPTVSHNILS